MVDLSPQKNCAQCEVHVLVLTVASTFVQLAHLFLSFGLNSFWHCASQKDSFVLVPRSRKSAWSVSLLSQWWSVSLLSQWGQHAADVRTD